MVRGLTATEMGVDHLGNLWAFDRHTGRVTFVTPDGETVAGPLATSAQSAAADRAWGVLALNPGSAALRVIGPDGKHRMALPVKDSVGSASWISADVIALSPDSSVARAELWSLTSASRIATRGTEHAVDKTTPGAQHLRRVWLRSAAGLLHTLEAYSGTLASYDETGNEVRSAAIEHPLFGEIESRMEARNEDAVKNHFIERPVTLLWNGFGVDAAQTIWVVEKASAKSQTMSFRRVDRAGRSTTETITGLACATYTFAIWGDWLITYGDPADPAGACIGEARMP